ncbi:MAG: hypothetical protein ACRDZR_01175 [Acidimicrobiales bacterium]
MTANPTGFDSDTAKTLQSANPESALTRVFTGRITGRKGLSEGVVAAKVVSATATTVTATVTGFFTKRAASTAPVPAVVAYYEPRPQASGTTKKPPAGTACFIAFPPNEPQRMGVVVAFVGWPT